MLLSPGNTIQLVCLSCLIADPTGVHVNENVNRDIRTVSTINKSLVIDALRGTAALAVLLSHGDHGNLINISGLSQIKGYLGLFGVNLFFIVSGYLIWISASKTLPHHQGLAIYAVHRATRLIPLYYVNIFAALVLIPMIGTHFVPSVSDGSFLRHITFTQALLPSVSREINPVLWTLTHEVIFYLIVPFLFLIFTGRWRIEWLLVMGALFMMPPIYRITGSFAPFFQTFYLFVVGIAVAEKCRNELPRWLALIALVVALIAPEFSIATEYCVSLIAIAAFMLVLSIWSFSAGFINRIVTVLVTPIAWMGVVSYSLYIWHYLLLNIISFHSKSIVLWLQQMGLETIWTSDLYRALGIIFSALMVSALSYWFIERPSMGVLRCRLLIAVQRQRFERSEEMGVK